MVRYVRDATGRFSERPHYDMEELDDACERLITAFMNERYGALTFPLPTDALTKLIERDTQDLDLYADLSGEGVDVEGVTDFFPGQKPKVRVARELAADARREHRLRTTLTHEYGHVHFHAYLWDMAAARHDMFTQVPWNGARQCRRETMFRAPVSDWMEWQAGYVCGALLMPVSAVRRCVREHVQAQGLYTPLHINSVPAIALIARVAEVFDVSPDAARVRLAQQGYVDQQGRPPSLFRV